MKSAALLVLGLSVTLAASTAEAILPPSQTAKLYVSNFSGNNVGVYDADGTYLYSLAPAGLSQPRGLVFLPNGQFMVASQNNDHIYQFRYDESLLRTFGHAELMGPTGMAIHDGLLYVSSFDNDRVVVFDFKGNYQFHFQGGQLNGPNCVAFDSQGFLYVSSAFTGTVIKFDPSQVPAVLPQVVDVFTPEPPVTLVSPMSIARNSNDVLYVSGGSSNNIVKFSTAGETLGAIALPGFAPQGIAFNDEGHFFTSSFNNVPYQILEFDENDMPVGVPITTGGLNVPRSLAFEWGMTGGDIPAASPSSSALLGGLLAIVGAVVLKRRRREGAVASER